MENEDAVISLGDVGEFGSGGGCSRDPGATWWFGCDGFGVVGGSRGSDGNDCAGGGGEGCRRVVGSLASGLQDVRGAGEGSRDEETGLERGGAGKREYLSFLASIATRFGGKLPCRRSKLGPKRNSGAHGLEIEEEEWVM